VLLEPDDGPVLADVLAALLPPAPADDVAGVPPHAPAATERIKPETSRNRMVPSYLSVRRFYVETSLQAMLRVALAIVAAAFIFVPTGCAPKNKALSPGELAPNFSLVGSDGKTHTLTDYRGKFVVLAWFPKANTSG